MPIVVHRSDRPEALADGLAAMLRDDPGDVFDPAWVVVPAQGVQRWLTQRLSHVLGAGTGDDGVCAGLDLRSPASLVGLLLGRDREDPWLPDRLAWPTLAAIDECMGAPGFDALTRHLGGGPTGGSPGARVAPARRGRPAGMPWHDGSRGSSRRMHGSGRPCSPTGRGAAPATGAAAHSTRTLPGSLSSGGACSLRSPAGPGSPSRRRRVTPGSSTNCECGTVEFAIPGRINLFGHTQLPASEIELLAALGTSREVHLWLPHPSPGLWDALADAGRGARPLAARADDASARPRAAPPARQPRPRRPRARAGAAGRRREVPPPLGASERLGGTGRARPDSRSSRPTSAPTAHPTRPAPSPRETCRSRSTPATAVPARSRCSARCSPQLFEDDPTLEPRDVLVLCPDVEEFAPLVRAGIRTAVPSRPLAGTPRHPGHDLRVQLADRRLAATNPLVELAQLVVGLVAGRVTASEVLGLAAHDAVARRFGFDEDDLATLGHWVAESGARWGLDADPPRRVRPAAEVADNTWANALDRLALGVAVAADSTAEAAENAPIDDIGSNDIALVGRFLELLDRVRCRRRTRSAGRPPRAAPAVG